MDEEIVMTPSKNGDTTIINIEKIKKTHLDESQVAHKAGGQHSGLVINKQQTTVDSSGDAHPHLQLEFKCFLVDQKSGKHIPENRCLKFWFPPTTEYLDKVTSAYEFFRELVRPEQFPRDYVGFIKKVMKQMQHRRYEIIKRIEVNLRQMKEEEAQQAANERATERRYCNRIYVSLCDAGGLAKTDSRPRELIVQEQLLHYLESAYPNILPTSDLMDMLKVDEATLLQQLGVLMERNLVKELEPGRWVRRVLDNKSELRIVKTMPSQMDGSRPKIAIITSKYYEKLAVDAMMEDKTTFVKFKTEGESNVYTIGYIAGRKVVSTKLPAIGRQRAAQISSGNTTTRLLGTFGEIDHVLLVGVCGGVPHYADFYKHVRLGDILVSSPVSNNNNNSNNIVASTSNNNINDVASTKMTNNSTSTSTTSTTTTTTMTTANNDYYYIYCDKTTLENDNNDDEPKSTQFSLKGWRARDSTLLNVARKVAATKLTGDSDLTAWEKYIVEGQKVLEDQEVKFTRPPEDTDRLFMNVGGNDVIEVGHPTMPEPLSTSSNGNDSNATHFKSGFPTIRMGPIGSGKPIVNNDQLRLEFAAKHHCVGFDSEFDQVLESIHGSRKDSYLLIRGVSDYLDGSTNATWQPYAALVSAAFMKSIIAALT